MQKLLFWQGRLRELEQALASPVRVENARRDLGFSGSVEQ